MREVRTQWSSTCVWFLALIFELTSKCKDLNLEILGVSTTDTNYFISNCFRNEA